MNGYPPEYVPRHHLGKLLKWVVSLRKTGKDMTDVWLWEMEMCCGMELEALRKEMAAYDGKSIAPGTKIEPGMTACPHDEMLFEAVRFWINVLENGRLEVVGRVFYWHAADGGWHKTSTLKTFDTIDDCLRWLEDKDRTGREECALILKNLGR